MSKRLSTAACTTALVCAIGSAAAGCGDGGDASDLGPAEVEPAVVIGAGNGAASQVEANIYADALRTLAGGRVTVRTGLPDPVGAVESGVVTMVPALTGDLMRRYGGPAAASITAAPTPASSGAAASSSTRSPASATTTAEWDPQYIHLSGLLPDGLGLGDATPALDQPMLYVRPGGITVLADCSSLHGTVVVAPPSTGPVDASAELVRVNQEYGCDFTAAEVLPAAEAARAVSDRRADAAELGTLAPEASGLTLLADPDRRVSDDAVVPLYRRSAVTTTQARAMNAVAGELKTADLAAMTAQVAAGSSTAEAEAGAWLGAHPLT